MKYYKKINYIYGNYKNRHKILTLNDDLVSIKNIKTIRFND